MSALVVLIAASLILASGFLFAFIRATKKGQYEDVYTPSVRILFEDGPQTINNETLKQVQSDSLNDVQNVNEEYEPSVPKKEKSQTTQKWN